jgi:hypothetical protein
MWTRRGSLKPADVAVEFGMGDAAAAADVYGTQLSALHERVHRRATDAEDLRRLLGREEKPAGGLDVPRRLRITHVGLSGIDRAFLRDACPERWGSGLQNISSPSPTARVGAFGSADWRVERLLLATAEVLKLGSEQVGSAGEVRASPVRRHCGLQGPRARAGKSRS